MPILPPPLPTRDDAEGGLCVLEPERSPNKLKRPRRRDGDPLPEHYEQFCRAIAEQGMTMYDAYKEFVSDAKCNFGTLRSKASTLCARPEISSRIKELRVDFKTFLEEKLNFGREQLATYLVEAIVIPGDEITEDSRHCNGAKDTKFGRDLEFVNKLGAAQLVSRLAGWNAADKLEVSQTSIAKSNLEQLEELSASYADDPVALDSLLAIMEKVRDRALAIQAERATEGRLIAS